MVGWKLVVGAVMCWAAVGGMLQAQDKESITVQVVGKLKTGIVAIGGETTGTTITAKEVTWELDLGKDEKLRAEAEKLDGKLALVKGTLERRPGLAIKERWIVTVSELRAADTKAVDKKHEEQGRTGASPPSIAVSGYHEGTQVEVTEGERTIIDFSKLTGIDRCVIKRTGDAWPKQMALRLHLSGLESLSVKAGDTVLGWAVSSTGEPTFSRSVSTGDIEIDLNTKGLKGKEEFLAAAKIVRDPSIASSERLIPLKNGYFEIELPAALFQRNPEQLRLQWIDFFR